MKLTVITDMQVEEVPGGDADKDNKDYRVNLLSFLERHAAESSPHYNTDSWALTGSYDINVCCISCLHI